VLPGKKQTYEEAKELRLETWRAFEDLYKQGKCKAIGVSNYMPRHLQEIIDSNMILPFVNQCEFSPFYTNKQVFDFCKAYDIVFEV
jgi:diketogulonate reductase-like aldo/keto reductase